MKGSLLIMNRASILVSTLHSLLHAFANLCTDTGASLASQSVRELATIADQTTVQNGYILASINLHGLK